MITWMQRHKKYLIITIWISTIAFVGAGFVGWGQYNYGDKASAVAKVGNIEITMVDLQKSYSRLYNQYAQMFQGNFDEEKAKQFGLKRQALQQLTQQSLLLNLANDYDLQITDKELLAEIKKQEYFFKDGVFNKEIYKTTLSRNRLSMKEYENDVKKQLLIQKLLMLFPTNTKANELNILTTLMNISDKINYKVLDTKDIKVDDNDKNLKIFWETKQQNFNTEVTYNVEYIKNTAVSNNYEDEKISTYYNQNKTHFKDDDGKILPIDKAKEAVVVELNAKDSKKSALKTYISYKKNQLNKNIKPVSLNISESNNPFTEEVIEKIASLSTVSPYLKPILIDGVYYTFKLIKINPSKMKSFQEAKEEVRPLFIKEKTEQKLIELAKKSTENFIGTNTDFITNQDALKLKNLSAYEANEFLIKLFTVSTKRGYIQLKSGKIVLYDILEQRLLDSKQDLTNVNDNITRLKSGIFNEGLIKNLQQKYKTEIFIEGL